MEISFGKFIEKPLGKFLGTKLHRGVGLGNQPFYIYWAYVSLPRHISRNPERTNIVTVVWTLNHFVGAVGLVATTIMGVFPEISPECRGSKVLAWDISHFIKDRLSRKHSTCRNEHRPAGDQPRGVISGIFSEC